MYLKRKNKEARAEYKIYKIDDFVCLLYENVVVSA